MLSNSSRYAHSRSAPLVPRTYVSSGSYRPDILLRLLEHLFVFLLLLSSMNVITALTPSSKQQAEVKLVSADVNTSAVIIEASVYAFGGVLVLMRWRRVLRAARIAWPLLALAVLASLSTAWSVQPMVTLRRSIWLLIGTVFAIYIGERYSIKEFAHLLARTFCFIIVLIFIFYWVGPDYVIDWTYAGAWKGLSAYKNTFGEQMAVAVVLLALVRFRYWPWTRYMFFLLAASLLLLSHSATGLVCGILALATVPIWRLIRGEQRLLGYMLAALASSLAIYCILAPPEPLFQMLGRDPSLTGRTRLWNILLPVIAARPFLGYGYAAFWDGWKPEVLNVWIQAQRLVPVADNGYIDLCLGLGAVGVSLFFYLFVQAFRHAVEYMKFEPTFIGVWPLVYLCIFAADNICESALLTRGTFSFLVFAILTTSLAIHHKNFIPSRRTAEARSFTWEAVPL